MNKKVIIVVTLALLLTAVSAGCVQSEKQVYTIGVNSALEPFSAKNINTGEPYGIDIDIFDLMAEQQGFDVKYVYVATSEFMDALEKGTIDVMTGKVINDERLKRCDFTDVYYTAKYGIVVRKDSGITVDDVLNGDATIAVHTGSAYETWLKNYHGAKKYSQLVDDGKIITKSSVNTVIYSVLSKEADSGMTSGGSISTLLTEFTPLKFAGYVSEGNDAGFAVKKGNTELLNLLNKGLRAIKASHEYDKIMEEFDIPYVKSEYAIGVDENNPPWTYLDENGKYTGFDVESLEWIAEKNGFKLTFENVPWTKNINAIITSDIDMFASGMSITDERLSRVAFSDPYISMGTSVFGKKSGIAKSDFESGKVITGIIYGTNHIDFLKEIFGSDKYEDMLVNGKIHMYESQNALEKGMTDGEIDVFVMNEAASSYCKDELGLHSVATYPGTDEFGYAMRNGDIEFQDVINKGLESLKTSGKRAELLEKYGLN
ncbi:MAG: transporter substrate-binding domain-containing protein [Methanocorpusculum sp.]|nr:transporter substrate-binding domain-containing protein [Methanocorpusculum sp.]